MATERKGRAEETDVTKYLANILAAFQANLLLQKRMRPVSNREN